MKEKLNNVREASAPWCGVSAPRTMIHDMTALAAKEVFAS